MSISNAHDHAKFDVVPTTSKYSRYLCHDSVEIVQAKGCLLKTISKT